MRSCLSNETADLRQQPLIEEQSIKRDPSSTDMPATNNQISGQGIQTDVIFIQKPQAAVSKVKPLYDNSLIMKHIPLVPSPKEKKLKFISTCDRDEFLVESKETKKRFSLMVKEEIVLSIEVPEKMKLVLESSKKLFMISFRKDYRP